MAGYVCHNCGRFVPALQGLGSRIFRRSLPLSARPPHIQLTRKEIMHFPNLTYPGRVVMIPHPSLEDSFKGVINEFAENKVLGFDTESKPTFQKYQKPYGPCLIQLASRDLCIMWRLRVGAVTSETFPPMLRSLLRARDITKVGHSSRFDSIHILRHFHISCRNVLDTEHFARKLNLNVGSLCGLTAMFLGRTISKKQCITNWDRARLTRPQVEYAATDAWVPLEVYSAMSSYAAQLGLIPPAAIEDTWDIVKDKERAVLERRLAHNSIPSNTPSLTHVACPTTTSLPEAIQEDVSCLEMRLPVT